MREADLTFEKNDKGADGNASAPSSLDERFSAVRSNAFDDIYFAGDGIHETRHVFIHGSDLPARFLSKRRFTIGELGFGTGLNLLEAWRAFDEAGTEPGARLTFISFEKFPLSRADLERVHGIWSEHAERSAILRDRLPENAPGFHDIQLAPSVSLLLYLGDVVDGLSRLDAFVDAWFLDGFSPAKNSDMWSASVFDLLAERSNKRATISTFTVAGAVRRGLSQAGFEVEKRPGFGRKRDRLWGQRSDLSKTPRDTRRPPWFQPPGPKPRDVSPKVAIIGAGVAGAAAAHALIAAGCNCTVFDPRGPAAGASGNIGGLIMPRLDLGDTPQARFFTQSYVHALRVIGLLPGAHEFFNRCGVFLRLDDAKADALISDPPLPANQIERREGGLFFKDAGVIDPQKYVQALLGDTQIFKTHINHIDTNDTGSVSLNTDDKPPIHFDAVIVANSVGALRLHAGGYLPISGVAGQIDAFLEAHAPASATAAGPYFAPAPGGGVLVGATYDKIDLEKACNGDVETSPAATSENINAVAALAPAFAQSLSSERAMSRASVRCQTPDRLPIVGPAPDPEFYQASYEGLKHGVKASYPPAEYQNGAWLLTGLGSRGLVTAPLCGALVAAQILGAPFDAPSPVDQTVADALHPGRFIFRELKRAQNKKSLYRSESLSD
ncbi:MAG: FAD-dependent 5-carboxymethylaminomethyl-2-thiouridine(34) oxidoreductase MnmC [Pseudomonadota bacterium]